MGRWKRGGGCRARVRDIDRDTGRGALGSKQREGDPVESAAASEIRKGAIVTCEVTDVKEGGLDVTIAGTDLTAFVRRSDLARDRSEQRPERFARGEKFDARITQFDRKTRKVSVSIKALEIAEEKQAVAQYGSTDSGASLGDILGAALSRVQGSEGEAEPEAVADEPAEAEKKPAKKAKKAEADAEAAEPAAEAAAETEEPAAEASGEAAGEDDKK